MSGRDPELLELLDKQAILECLHRYTRGLDRHDEALIASAFHDDSVDHHGEFLGTPAEFLEWQRTLHGQWSAHTHFLDCNHIEIDDDVAHAESYVLFVHRRQDDSAVELGGGRYIDRLERRSNEWRISARQLLIEWTARADSAIYADVASYPSGRWDHRDPSYERPFTLDAEQQSPKASAR
jgi:hypothetical protein